MTYPPQPPTGNYPHPGGYYPPPPPWSPPPEPPKRGVPKFLKVIGGGFAVLLFAGMCSSLSNNSSTPASSSTGRTTVTGISTTVAAAAPTAVTTAAVPAPKFGQEVVTEDGLALSVSAPRKGDGTFGKTSCVTVSYDNRGTGAESFNQFDWSAAVAGVEVSSSFFGGRDADAGLGSGDLRPGGKRSGEVCFEAKSGTPTEVIYDGGLFDQPITWTA